MDLKVIIGFIIKIVLCVFLVPLMGESIDGFSFAYFIIIPVAYGLASYIVNVFLYGGLVLGIIMTIVPILVSDFIPEPWMYIVNGILILGSAIIDFWGIFLMVRGFRGADLDE